MNTSNDIENALRVALPSELHASAPALAQLLADVGSGALSLETAQARLSQPTFAPLFKALAGQSIEVGTTILHFAGDTSIATAGGDYATRDLDKRQGAFISGTIEGNVIGIQTQYYQPAPDSARSDRNRRAMLERVQGHDIIFVDSAMAAKMAASVL